MRIALALIAALLTLAGCERTPTGRSQLALVPESAMENMGQQAFAQMRQTRPVVSGGAAGELVSCIAREVTAAARRVYPEADVPADWEVALFRDPSPNAFALPGGRIGVHTGMVELAGSPGQLAAVIGHEVGHVLADHGNERLTQELGITAALYLVGLFSEGEVGDEQLRRALGIGARLGIALPFSRAHEREADLMGLTIMAEAGFDPRESVQLWRRMAEAGGGQPVEFLSTHPSHASRIEVLRENMASALERFAGAVPARCGR